MGRIGTHPALLIIDMQNGFCHPKGSFARIGMPITRMSAVIPRIGLLRDLCRAAGIPVFYTAVAFDADYQDAGIAEEELTGLKEAKGFVRGTWDSQIVDELSPAKDEVVVSKTKNNAFWGSNLNQVLQDKHINQIIATGVGTNVCVESTVREARSYGFRAITVSDGTATLSEEAQQASITNLEFFGGTVRIDELETELRERARAA